MAEIFANRLRDPAGAAYHYRRILALHATGQRADATRAALHRLEGGSPNPESGHPKGGGVAKLLTPEQAAAEAEKAAKGKVHTYVVQSGDTLVLDLAKVLSDDRWLARTHSRREPESAIEPRRTEAGQTIILP